MKWFCKIKHRWLESFTVLTKHWENLEAPPKVKWGRVIPDEQRYLRECKRCGKIEVSSEDILGYPFWKSPIWKGGKT